jgi:predicted O-methyltransferase YrrM
VVADPLRRLIDRPWRESALPSAAVGIPTMLSKAERRLLYTLARDYAGDGAIVDAGCFLGGSTAALLAGVQDRADGSVSRVTSYDLFRMDALTMPKFFPDDGSLQVGESFRQRFDDHVARFDVPHEVREGDITELGWSGEPIDVLFLDVLKSWEINDAVLRDFFPSLVPGRSVVVHQDYGWGDTPWIPITVELMRESLVLLDWMEWGSHVFFLEGELPAGLLADGVAGLDLDTKLAVMDQAVARAEGWVQGMLEISRTFLIVECDGPEAALAELSSIRERHPHHGSVLACIDDVRPAIAGAAAAPAR